MTRNLIALLSIGAVGFIALLIGRRLSQQHAAAASTKRVPKNIPYATIIPSDASRLRQLEESKRPTGETSLGATISTRTRFDLPDPFISFTLINDGPNSVYLEINTDHRPNRVAPILINESYSYDATYPVIKFLIFDVDTGETAAIRLRGKTGKHFR